MIQVVAGKKGSGKTKRIIDMANLATKDSKHDIVFIDDDNRYMFDLRHEVRFINASEYDIANDQMSTYKRVKRFKLRDTEFEKTTSRKIKRHLLK